MQLIDVFRAYPGGIDGLSKSASVPAHTLYRVANREHRKVPVAALDRIGTVLSRKMIFGKQYNGTTLKRMWEEKRRKKSA